LCSYQHRSPTLFIKSSQAFTIASTRKQARVLHPAIFKNPIVIVNTCLIVMKPFTVDA
jgi:hypothetical protein